MGGAVLDRGRAAHARRRPSCSASRRRRPAWSSCAAPSAATRRSPSRAWCTRARATCCRESSSHEHRVAPGDRSAACAPRVDARASWPPSGATARSACASCSRPPRWRCCATASTPTSPRRARAPSSPAGPTTPASSSRTSATGSTTRPTAASIFDSPLAAAAGALMRSAAVRLYHDHMLTKEPGTRAAHAVAPGPAVLQRRRPAERQHLDAGRPGAPPLDARVRRRLAPRPVADAAHLHGPAGEVVPRRQPGRPARHRRRTRDQHRILGWEIEPGDVVVLPHARAARGGRCRRRPPAARVLGALPRRRHAPRAARAGRPRPTFPGLADELPAGAPMDASRCSRCCGSACRMSGAASIALSTTCAPQPGATAAAARASCSPGRPVPTGAARQRGRHRRRRARSRAFPGVQRWFAVLQGAGVRADAAPTASARVRPCGDAPLRFDGAAAPRLHAARRADARPEPDAARAAPARWRVQRARRGRRLRAARRCRALFTADAATLQAATARDTLRAAGASRWPVADARPRRRLAHRRRRAGQRAWWMPLRAARRMTTHCCGATRAWPRWPAPSAPWGWIERGALLTDGEHDRAGSAPRPSCRADVAGRAPSTTSAARCVTPGPGRLPHPPRLRRPPRARVRAAPAGRELRGDRARRRRHPLDGGGDARGQRRGAVRARPANAR